MSDAEGSRIDRSWVMNGVLRGSFPCLPKASASRQNGAGDVPFPGRLKGSRFGRGRNWTERNAIHGSDSVESARREISLWFRPEELTCWEDAAERWISK